MRHLITTLWAVLAFVAGTVVAGIIGDQGPGLDLLPLAVGLVCATTVVALRLRHRQG